eukprot:g2857.t1
MASLDSRLSTTQHGMAALEEFFTAAGLEPEDSRLYAAKCDSEGYNVETLSKATFEELVEDLDMKKGHARTVHRHCMTGSGSDSSSGRTSQIVPQLVQHADMQQVAQLSAGMSRGMDLGAGTGVMQVLQASLAEMGLGAGQEEFESGTGPRVRTCFKQDDPDFGRNLMDLPGDKGTVYWFNWWAGALTPTDACCCFLPSIVNALCCCGSLGWWYTGNHDSSKLCGDCGRWVRVTAKDPEWAKGAPLRAAFEGRLSLISEAGTMAPYRDRQMCCLRSFASCGQRSGDNRFKKAPECARALNDGWCRETNDTLLHAKGYTCKAYHHSYTSATGDGDAKNTYIFYIAVVRYSAELVPHAVVAQAMDRSDVPVEAQQQVGPPAFDA